MHSKKKEDTLFSLVKSLNRSEKRFFTLYAQVFSHNKTPNYLHLFKILDEMEEYNRESVLKKIEKFSDTKHLNQLKSYLKNHLSIALKHYDKTNNIYIKQFDQLANAEILLEKGLLELSSQIFQKQKKEFVKDEKYLNSHFVNLKLIRLENLKEQNSLEKQKKIKQCYLDSLELLNHQLEITTMGRLVMKYRLILYNKNRIIRETRKDLEKILKEDFLPLNPNSFLSMVAKSIYFNNIFLIYKNLDNDDQCLKIVTEHYKLLSHPTIIHNTNIQCLVRANLSEVHLKRKDFKNFFLIMDEFYEILNKSIFEKKIYIHIYYLRLLKYYLEQTEDILPQKIVSKIFEEISNPQIAMPLIHKNSLHTYLAKYYLKHEQIQKAQDMLLKITLTKVSSPHDFHFLEIRIMNIICLYENDLPKIVNRDLLSLKRKLKREDLLNQSLDYLLKLITQLNNCSKTKKKQYYHKIHELIIERISQQDYIFKKNLSFLNDWILKKMIL